MRDFAGSPLSSERDEGSEMTVQHTITAVMENPDEIKPNPIHSTSVAQSYGLGFKVR